MSPVRIGFVGPAAGRNDLLREAAEFLLGKADVDQLVYLGTDDVADAVVEAWASELIGAGAGQTAEDAFLAQAAQVACGGSADEIRALLASDAAVRRLDRIRKIPAPPARAIEMIDDRFVVVVYDKSVLDEEDIANAYLLVYGKSDDVLFKRFGPRYFFTPGPLVGGRVGILEIEDENRVAVALYEPNGAPIWHEPLLSRPGSKMTVST